MGLYIKTFFLDSDLLGNSVKALLLISGFPLHFERGGGGGGGGKSALFTYFCTRIVKQYNYSFLRVKTPLQRVNGNAEYNLEDATVPMFSCFVNSMYKAWDHFGDYSPILRTFQYFFQNFPLFHEFMTVPCFVNLLLIYPGPNTAHTYAYKIFII